MVYIRSQSRVLNPLLKVTKSPVKTHPRFWFYSLPPSNLALGKRRHPSHDDIEGNDHAAHDPETLGVIRAMEPEQNGEYDAAEVAHGAHRATEDTVGVWMDVRDKSEIGPVVSVLAI